MGPVVLAENDRVIAINPIHASGAGDEADMDRLVAPGEKGTIAHADEFGAWVEWDAGLESLLDHDVGDAPATSVAVI